MAKGWKKKPIIESVNPIAETELVGRAKQAGFDDAQIESLGDKLEETVQKVKPISTVSTEIRRIQAEPVQVPQGGETEILEIRSVITPTDNPYKNRTSHDDGQIASAVYAFTRIARQNKTKVFVERIEKDQSNIPDKDRNLITMTKVTVRVTK